MAGVWADFTRYGRLDGSDPPTLNLRCSPKAWPVTEIEAGNNLRVRVRQQFARG